MGESFTIRTATIDDLDEVARLYIALKNHHAKLQPDNLRYQVEDARWAEAARKALEDRAVTCLLAERGAAIGFMKLSFVEKVWGTSCEIDTLVVDDAARGQGVGAALVAAAERTGRRRGARAMRVDVLTRNLGGVAFYEREGYEQFAVRLGKSLD